MIHVSLRAIGRLDGGPDAVLDALEAAIGEDGTLLMILGAEIAQDRVNRLPEPERLPLLADAPPFDPATAPVFHEVGYFAELFRRRAGTLVTDNPSGRFGARGRLAQDLLADAPWHDYYGPGSPLDRFCRQGGRILRMGANLDTTTVLHFAEYRAEVSAKRGVPCAATIAAWARKVPQHAPWNASTTRRESSIGRARITSPRSCANTSRPAEQNRDKSGLPRAS